MAVSKQFNNRRQPVLINAIDPEILTEAKLSTDGYVKNTDYATSTTGGVVKVSNTYGTRMSSDGVLYGISVTEAQYASLSNNAFVIKGTLENIFDPKVIAYLTTIAAGYDAAEVGTKWKTIVLEKTADGPVVTFEAIAPPTP